MSSKTLVVERLSVSGNQINTEEDLMRDLSKRPCDARVVGPKLSESLTLAPDVPIAPCHAEGSGMREHHTCSSAGNGLSASQNVCQAVTESCTVQNSQMLSPDYADPKRVPGTDQYIYPCGLISPEFHERYPQLVDFFKQAVDTHKLLKYHTAKINYELRLCGNTPSNAAASIIIFCTGDIFKDLRQLLNSKHIRRQYQPRKPSVSVLTKFQSPPSTPAIAPFKVVFWREATTPTDRKATVKQVATTNHSFLTMCGSLVAYGDRTSTLGLLISVDSKLYGLTVDHLFKPQDDKKQPTIIDESSIFPDEDDTEVDHEHWSWVDDVTYEDIDTNHQCSDDGLMTSKHPRAEVKIDQGPTEYEFLVNGHKVDSPLDIDTSIPYLDWALIEFDNGYFERPNAFYPETDLEPKFFTRLATTPQTNGVHVFMISGISGTRKGVLLKSTSYIGGKPGENLCEAWNVILSDSGRVIDGDCGSLIVDQETLEVYGHVVASNPLSEAYVVPLRNTFRQISDALGAKHLSLPNPRLLMKNLVNYYSTMGSGGGFVNEAKLILASMEEAGSLVSQHVIEDQNPPCNTIYIDNLPFDTSEDELKAIFSKQRGYKRLCFRTKQNGPMCLVEFEEVSFAAKALYEIYHHPSFRGGIRLSFSKNPLGVRSGQNAPPPERPPNILSIGPDLSRMMGPTAPPISGGRAVTNGSLASGGPYRLDGTLRGGNDARQRDCLLEGDPPLIYYNSSEIP